MNPDVFYVIVAPSFSLSFPGLVSLSCGSSLKPVKIHENLIMWLVVMRRKMFSEL